MAPSGVDMTCANSDDEFDVLNQEEQFVTACLIGH